MNIPRLQTPRKQTALKRSDSRSFVTVNLSCVFAPIKTQRLVGSGLRNITLPPSPFSRRRLAALSEPLVHAPASGPSPSWALATLAALAALTALGSELGARVGVLEHEDGVVDLEGGPQLDGHDLHQVALS